MSSTKRILADQILYRLAGTYPDVAGAVQKPDVIKAIEQWINARFKLQQFNTTLPSGETIPDNATFATYENVPVTSSNGKCTATLPVMPISLPRGLGIYDINDGKGTSYIPIMKGQGALLRSDYLLNTLFDQVSYEQSGKTITFSLDITLYGVNTVEMILACFDMSLYSETDMLPLPPDMEFDCINDLYKMFSPINSDPGEVNNYPSTIQTK